MTTGETLPLPVAMIGAKAGDDLFLLHVTDNAMDGALIFEGDWAIVCKQAPAGHGDLVAAMSEGAAIVRRLIRPPGASVGKLVSEGRIRGAIRADKATILGKVTAIIHEPL